MRPRIGEDIMGKLRRRTVIGSAIALGLASAIRRVDAQQARTLIVAASGTPQGFDGDALRPHTQETVVQVYDPLARYRRMRDAAGREQLDSSAVEPHLAESWTVSGDGKTYLFKLRQGVKSFFGNELTAADVEWSWAKSFAQQRTGRFIANVSSVAEVKAKSRHEVEFTLSAPSSIFLKALTLYVPGIYDSTEVKTHATSDDPWALKWMENNTAGFGPYHVESVRQGEQAVFVANPNYFGATPHYNRVIYRAVPSGANRVLLLRSGQVQWIERPTIEQVLDMRNDRRVKIDSTTGRLFAALWMNARFEPFNDIRVRRALNHAVDREAILGSVFRGEAAPARTIISPTLEGHDPSFFDFDYNPAKARQLLAEAGKTNVQVEILYSDAYWWLEAMAIQTSDQLRAIGVTAAPRRVTAAEMRARFAPNLRDMPLFAWEDGPLVLDPVYALFLLAHSRGAANRNGYTNPEVDALIDRARQEQNPQERLRQVRDLQRIIMADAPLILSHYPTIFEAMAPNITGWVAHPDDHERWAELRAG
jgi:ABC-type transport system substrate-binding protein